MKQFVTLAVLTFAFACGSSGGGSTSQVAYPGHGGIAIQVVPNPIVATRVSGSTYDFPFDVIIRETGGHTVNVSRVSADVTALGSIPVASQTYDAAAISRMGYPTTLAPNAELRYHFAPRKDVPDERLFGGVSALLTVEGTDDTGTATQAQTTVTVTR